jgi:hypothetical protein
MSADIERADFDREAATVEQVEAMLPYQPGRAVPDAIRSAGSKMSNVMFNLSQANDSHNAKLYGELYREWDAAIRSAMWPTEQAK